MDFLGRQRLQSASVFGSEDRSRIPALSSALLSGQRLHSMRFRQRRITAYFKPPVCNSNRPKLVSARKHADSKAPGKSIRYRNLEFDGSASLSLAHAI